MNHKFVLWRVILVVFCFVVIQGCMVPDDPMSATEGKQKQAESYYLLGMSFLGENNPSRALEELLKAVDLAPKNAQYRAGLAHAYAMKKAFGLAEQQMLKAIELSGGDAGYKNNLGAIYLSMARYDDAILAFESARDDLTFPQSEVAWGGIGYAYYLKKDYAAAEKAYKEAVKLNGRYAQAHFRLGELYYMQDRSVEAQEAFSKTVSLAPSFATGHYWLGLTQMKTRDPLGAEKSFKEVVKLAPESEEARLSRNYLKILTK